MADERLTYQEIDEYSAVIGLALLLPGEQVNDFTVMLDRICCEHQEMQSEIDKLQRELSLLRAMVDGK